MWAQKIKQKQSCARYGPTNSRKQAMFSIWTQKVQIQTHLLKRRRTHKRAVMAVVLAVAVAAVAVSMVAVVARAEVVRAVEAAAPTLTTPAAPPSFHRHGRHHHCHHHRHRTSEFASTFVEVCLEIF